MKTIDQWKMEYEADKRLPADKRTLRWSDGSLIQAIRKDAWLDGYNDGYKRAMERAVACAQNAEQRAAKAIQDEGNIQEVRCFPALQGFPALQAWRDERKTV